MRRRLGSCLLAALILGLVGVAPVAAAGPTPVSITVTTTFDDIPDDFVAEGLPDVCDDGVVENGPAHVQITPAPGIFAGYKVFDCGSDSGFVLRLNARFGGGGSVGTWSVVASWGDVAGMRGAGKLTGEPIEGGPVPGIIDTYVGIVVL